jgi:hypothetical protein
LILGNWFGGDITLEKYIRDLDNDRFDDILTKDSFNADASQTTNIVLSIAGPIKNFKSTDALLRTIHSSMSKEDLFITTLKRDTPQAREFFDFNIESDKKLLNLHDSLALDLLNIEGSFYELEQFFDPVEKLRKVQVRLKIDLSIHFELNNFQRVVDLHKGDVILLIRVWHFSEQELLQRFQDANFKLQRLAISPDDQLAMFITKVDAIY